MKKIYIKRIICLGLFLSVVITGFWYSNQILIMKRTDGITTIKELYAQQEDSIDVLMLGSSHCGMNLDTEVLWSEYGISSYALWGSVQPFWNSYYFLQDALKTQNPKVVLLETYAATLDFEYSDDARQITNVLGMKWSKEKLNAIKTSAPQDRWKDLILGLPLYHSRYSELTQNDFRYFPWSSGLTLNKGTGYRYGDSAYDLLDVSNITEEKPLHEKEEIYLKKIIELCKDEDIPLLLITTPSVQRAAEQPYYNSVSRIAHQYDVPYYNFNLMDNETFLSGEDFWNDDSHVNTRGARKISKYLGRILKDNYQLDDHRGDSNYSSWEENAINIQNNYLQEITETTDYFDELKRNDRTIMIIKNSAWDDTNEYALLLNEFSKIGIDSNIIRTSMGGNWILDSTFNGTLTNQYYGDLYSEYSYDGQSFSMNYADESGFVFNGKTIYSLAGPGIILIIYDKNTRSCIDIVTFLQSNSFQLQHEVIY